MSYCRWSSDGFRSDVYVYADVSGGWTTHVAGSRRLNLDTLPPDPYEGLWETGKLPADFNERSRAYYNALELLPFEDIDLPDAGKSFNHSTPQECAANLQRLKNAGFHVPDGVIETLENEKDDEEAE